MKSVRANLDTHLSLNIDDLGPEMVSVLRSKYTRANPKFANMKRLGFSTWNTPKQIFSWEMDEPWIVLPRGTLEEVRTLFAKEGLGMTIEDRTLELQPIKLSFNGTLRPYQKEAVDSLVSAGCGTLRGPCGSGKTHILLAAISVIRQPTLVMVHNTALARQWKTAASRLLGVVPGSIGGGENLVRTITIGMQQTLWRKQDKNLANQFGLIVGDEIHRWGSRTFDIVASMFPARRRIGGSNDERRKDGLEFKIYETFGPCCYKIERSHLVDTGKLLPSKMTVVRTDYVDETYMDDIETDITPSWGSMITSMTKSKERNDRIEKHLLNVLDLNKDARILVLSDRVDACFSWITRLVSKGISAGIMIGGVEHKRSLEETIDGLRSGRVKVGVGTVIADEGLDIPELTHVFLTCPVHTHPKRMTQMIGRVARPCKGKEKAEAIYFWDSRMFPRPIIGEDTLTRLGREDVFFKKRFKPICDEVELV